MKILILLAFLFGIIQTFQSQYNCTGLGEIGCIAELKNSQCQWCGSTNNPQCIKYTSSPCDFPKKAGKVFYGNKELGSSEECLYVEGNYYFPLESLNNNAWEGLTLTQEAYHCPWKGPCLYWNFTMNGQTHNEAAWTYWTPFPAAEPIRNYIGWSKSFFKIVPTH